jgi:gamma-glutamylaminecyclotransferase
MGNLEEDFRKCNRVAVYGTLKRGFWNHDFLKGCRFLDIGITKGRYKLFDVGYPYAVPDKNGLPLLVEVYELPSPKVLSRLDFLEGYPNHYKRKIETIHTESGDNVRAWLYYTEEPDGEPYRKTVFWKDTLQVLVWEK